MIENPHPTSFVEVNATLDEFNSKIGALLGSRFHAMYVIGSLALGDFDPNHSDIDFVVVTDTDLSEAHFRELQAMHAQFAASSSPWAAKVEAVYATRAALRRNIVSSAQFPQLERGTALFKAALEDGWVFQCHTLREYALVISGPDPRLLIDPIDPQAMRPPVAKIAGLWLEQAQHDPEWLAWVSQRDCQAFVILTLCRMLYSLAAGDVASKPVAARWAQTELGQPWTDLIASTLARQYEQEQIRQSELTDTVAFIRFTVDRSQPE